ncbi:MAG TPA: hypothetical protein DIW16_09025, partial [Marinobacter hydrocarbonoclasticus]|nr:hypothetical protein [Marinobacter nauticus]
MTEQTESQREGAWAHPYQLASGQTQQHQLGHTRVWITLLDLEWQVREQKLDIHSDPLHWQETLG